MTIGQIDRLIRDANPVLDLDALEPIDTAVLLQEIPGREAMQTYERIHIDAPVRRRRPVRHLGWAITVGVVLVGLLVGMSIRDVRVAAVSNAAAETATSFLEARQIWDAETALGYLADDALVSIPPARSVDEIPMELAMRQAIGWIYEVDSCSVVEAHRLVDGTRRVLCSVTHHNDLSRALGVGPYTTARFTMDVNGGLITSVFLSVPLATYTEEALRPFWEWIVGTHPEDVEKMISEGSSTPVLTAESIDLWRRFIAEFVAEQES